MEYPQHDEWMYCSNLEEALDSIPTPPVLTRQNAINPFSDRTWEYMSEDSTDDSQNEVSMASCDDYNRT